MSTLRAQRLAYDAHERVKARAVQNVVPSKYTSRVRNLPIWIRENGLIQALAFLQDKANGESGETDKQLLEDLAVVLKCGTCGKDLIEKVEGANSTAYRLLTRDAIAIAMWMKRWCETYQPPKIAKRDEENEDAAQ